MMGSRRTIEKDQQPTSSNAHLSRSSIFQEGNFSTGHFDSIPDSSLLFAPDWENIYSMNQPITQGIPEATEDPMMYLINPSSFQNPQIHLNSSTANTDIPEVPSVPSLPEWDTRWSPQFINQPHNAMSAGGMNDINFENPWSTKNPITARNFTGNLQMNRLGSFNRPQLDASLVHSRPRDNFSFNTSGAQGKFEENFLSLGIGGTEEATTSQPVNREISNRLKEAASAELKMARARKVMGQALDANFTNFQRNTSGLNHMLRIPPPTGNEFGVDCSPNSGPGYQMQQIDNSNFLSSRNMGYGDANLHRVLLANHQAVHSGTTVGNNSSQFLNSQQYDLNRVAPESSKPSWTFHQTPSGQLQNIRFKPANNLQIPSETSINSSLKLGTSSTRQHHPGLQPLLQNHISQRTGVPQVSWVNSGQGVTDLPFPKRLGVEFNGREIQAQRVSNLQTTSTGQSQTCHFPDNRVVQPCIGMSSQPTFFTHGQLQNPRPPAPTTTTTTTSVRPYQNHKRSAVTLPSGPHWVQRQKMTPVTHPATHHSMPIRIPTKPPVTTSTTSVPVTQSQTHRIRAAPPSVKPHTSNIKFKPRPPVTTPPLVAHITRKDPETSSVQLTRYKCLLCKRDLSMTSEGAVYQPTAPPPVAVLPCGHTFHDDCLQKITPQDQAKDPPCIPCALGED